MRRFLLVLALLASLIFIASPAHAAGIIVNTNADDNTVNGNCTLREAITAANSDAPVDACTAGSGADTITFASNYTITLAGSELPAVTSAVTINGNGAANTVVQAGTCNPVTLPGGCTPATYRVFEVGNTGNLTLANLTVQNGNCPSTGSTCSFDSSSMLRGGGIYNGGTLSLSAVTVTGSSAQSYGGGIFDDTGSTLTMQNGSLVSGNTATQSGGGIAHFSSGGITIDHSTISANTAAANGGGIYQSGGTLRVQNGSLIGGAGAGNTASLDDGWGGGIDIPMGTATIDASAVSANMAQTGGGISIEAGTLMVRNHSLIGGPGAAGNKTSGGDGAGIGASAGVVTVDASTVSGNTGALLGGGIGSGTKLVIQNGSHIGEPGAGNSARGGGGIWAYGPLTIDASTVSANTAQGGGGIVLDHYESVLHIQHGSVIGGPGAGNVASIGGGGIESAAKTVIIDASTVSDNTAGEFGGGIYNYNAAPGSLTITHSRIEANAAPDGGGFYNQPAAFTSITGSCLVNNGSAAFENANDAPQTATGNWWGAADGPNPPGSGDATLGLWDTSDFVAKPFLNCGGSEPSGLTVNAGGTSTIHLSWTDESSDETNFRVERSANGVSNWAEIGTANANTPSYSDSTLTCNTTRYYRVRAYRSGDGQFSDYSNVGSATTGACALPPAAPSGLAATANGTATINLTWTDHSNDETNFRVERSNDGSTGWAEVGTAAANAAGYSDSTLACNTTRYYRVRAYRSGDGQFSDYSNVDHATTGACPLIAVSPDAYNFSSLAINHTSPPVTITVTNHGAATVTVDPVSAPTNFAATTGCDHGSLGQGDSCTFDVTFRPTTPGAKSGTLTVTTSGGSASILLSGTGLSALTAPVLRSPKNGTISSKQAVKLGWKTVKGAKGYHVEVGTDNLFANPLTQVGDPTKTTFTTKVLPFGVYFWHVATKDALGQGVFSAPFSFEVTLNKSPKKGVTLTSGLVKFKWAAIKGKTYLLEYSSDPAFPSGPLTIRPSSTKKTSYAVPKGSALAGGSKRYYWHVSIDNGAHWTPYWTFIIR